MKTLTMNRLCTALILACMSFALVACDSQSNAPTTPITQAAAPGPNAGLSNDDLLAKAVANMKSAQSYHFEEKGSFPDPSIQTSPNTSIWGDIEESGKVSKGSMVDGLNFSEWRITADKSYYESSDGGKTWRHPIQGSPVGFMVSYLGWLWNGDNALGERIVGGLTLKDGTPASEEIDGVYTKRMTAEAGAGASGRPGFTQYAPDAKSLTIWVSTDITPTIRQMRIEGVHTIPTNKIEPAISVAFSPDGKTLAVAHDDFLLRVWDLTKPGSAPKKLEGKYIRFQDVAFSPDGKTLAAGVIFGETGSVYLWDTNNLDAAPTILNTSSSITAVAFRPDGKMLAAGGQAGLYLWEPPYKDIGPAAMPGPQDGGITSVAFSPDSNAMAIFIPYAEVRLYDTRHLEVAPITLAGTDSPREVSGLAFSPDGRLLAGSNDARIWDLTKPGSAALILTPGEGASQAMGLAFSPDGKRLAARDTRDTIEIWDMGNPTAPSLVLGDRTQFGGLSIAFSPDGKTIASTLDNGKVELWDMQNPGPASTPTILEEDEKNINTPFTISWTWSRFNEDLGEVKAPPTEPIKSP